LPPTQTLLALLAAAPLPACSFDAAGLGQSGPGGPDSPVTSGDTTGFDTTTGPTTGPTSGPSTQTTGSESGTGESSETLGSDSSGAVEPGTSSSTTDGTSTTDTTTTTGGPDTTTGGESSSSSGGCREQAFFKDDDGDGFGDPDELVMACEQPDEHVANGDDCDDGNDDIHPDADEICDGKDNDCDTHTDEFAADTNVDCEGCKMALYSGAVYHFCPNDVKWADAKSACEARGAALADDETMDEHVWLVTQLPVASGPWHIGGRAPNGDDMFVWLDGTPVPPPPDLRWAPGRPVAGGGTNFMALVSGGNLDGWAGSNGGWYDRAINDKEPYVCEGPLH
jgi:hypothetical protein